ncbi:sigma-70 family RNA polymerase sigma factor [Acidobacteriia bacterium AH_259_A11_L15]|nr:sigma-70 family RNA polymerase sigma factor [Acidobacteriia bacterium AH_259_A11_L15]
MEALRPTAVRWESEATAERQGPPAETRARSQEAQAEERDLIVRAQRGDQEAFAALLRLHRRRVFALIGHLVRQPADIEDLAQQVFLKVYRALGRFNFQASFSTWLHRIVINECYDHLRRQRARKSSAGNEVAVEDLAELERLGAAGHSPRPVDAARRVELRQTVEQLFARLPAADRLLLALRELEGLSMEEIARVLGVKENTVKVRLFRARKRLVEIHRRLQLRDRARKRGAL